jgi:hypothetical protein
MLVAKNPKDTTQLDVLPVELLGHLPIYVGCLAGDTPHSAGGGGVGPMPEGHTLGMPPVVMVCWKSTAETIMFTVRSRTVSGLMEVWGQDGGDAMPEPL